MRKLGIRGEAVQLTIDALAYEANQQASEVDMEVMTIGMRKGHMLMLHKMLVIKGCPHSLSRSAATAREIASSRN